MVFEGARKFKFFYGKMEFFERKKKKSARDEDYGCGFRYEEIFYF